MNISRTFNDALTSFSVVSLLSFILLFGCATGSDVQTQKDSLPVQTKDGAIHYEKVEITKDEFKKKDLFHKAKQWIAQYYSTKLNYNPMQLEDDENGVIIGKIFFKYSTEFFIHQMDYTVYCVFKLQVKDGRYKYTFSDFTYVASGTHSDYRVNTPKSCNGWIAQHNAGHPSNSYTKALSGLDRGINSIITSLQKSLNESSDF